MISSLIYYLIIKTNCFTFKLKLIFRKILSMHIKFIITDPQLKLLFKHNQ